jgi:pimeloyl-ACP methyl ester carboxylesterase
MGKQAPFMREEAVLIGKRQSLVGILTHPRAEKQSHRRRAVILLNPGIVHRVGPGRIYVQIARTLAEKGWFALRFDFSGIGDSAVRADSLDFNNSAISETQDAIDLLTARGVDEFVLLGGCSGARISLDVACCDPRVKGASLINFPIGEDDDEDGAENPDLRNRQRSHYYWNYALFDPNSWRKLITGKANYLQVAKALWGQVKLKLRSRNPGTPSELETKLRTAVSQGVQVTFIYAAGDLHRRDLRQALGKSFKSLSGSVTVATIPRSDHTFSSIHDQEQLVKSLLKIMERMTPVEYSSLPTTQVTVTA